jgi:hypothetical protein
MRAQRVVDAPVGHLTEILTHDTGYRARVGLRMVAHRA